MLKFLFSPSWLHIDKGMVAMSITSFFPMETKTGLLGKLQNK